MLIEPLLKNARDIPDSVAVVDDRGQTTYAELAEMAARLGQYITQQTQQPRVGILLPASAGFVASFYGTLLAGKTVIPINFLLDERQIAHCIKDSGVDTVITIPQLADKMKDHALKVIDITALPTPPAAAITPKVPQKSVDGLAVVMYPSGPGGLPRGAMLTYGNLHYDTVHSIEAIKLTHEHTFLGVIPLFHAFGMMASMLAPMQLGSKAVYIGRFSPAAAINAIREHKISFLFGVPSMFGAIANMKTASADDFKTMYAVISGGEPLSPQVADAFLKKFGKPILQGYGLTETSPAVCFNTPQTAKTGSVGKPIPTAEFRITGEKGEAMKTGETGEIWIKGPMVMKGYLNLPDATKEVLTADGHFKSGDLGKIDEEGFLFITGRKKDLIIVAGEKVFPREIEELLMKHPAVADAAVVGKKDESRGEAVVAFVEPKKDQKISADELKELMKQNNVPNWKAPKEYHIVDDLPRSPTGKVLKRELAEKLKAEPAEKSKPVGS
ncbi:long-chain fatty acid--CoA ligase [soil metagenome]